MSESPEPDDIPYRRNDHMHELIRSVSRRPPSDAPYLAESTARYILQKSNENKTGNERDIEEALAALPLRITRLLYDLAILSQGGYLDDLDKNWNYLDIDENRDYLEEIPDHLIYVTRYSHARNTASNRDDFYFNLGFNVGLGLSAVTGTISEDIRASKFLAGFTTAYSTDHFQRSRRSSNNSEINSEIDPDRKQLLERYGVEPTKYIDEHINFLNFGWSNIEEREILSPKEATQEFLEERASVLV